MIILVGSAILNVLICRKLFRLYLEQVMKNVHLIKLNKSYLKLLTSLADMMTLVDQLEVKPTKGHPETSMIRWKHANENLSKRIKLAKHEAMSCVQIYQAKSK